MDWLYNLQNQQNDKSTSYTQFSQQYIQLQQCGFYGSKDMPTVQRCIQSQDIPVTDNGAGISIFVIVSHKWHQIGNRT